MNDQVRIGAGGRDQSLTEAAGLSTGPVPMEPYRSPEFYKLEQERVFRRSWLLMCRVEELPNPGDYVVKQIEVCKASIIIARGKDGTIRALHNVCSHRGNQVVLDEKGTGNRFMCRYHNWTYANDGRLLGVPDESAFFSIDKKECGLTKVACDVWEGFVFINLTPEPEATLSEFLGEFGQYFKGVEYIAAEHPVVFRAVLDCNWKVLSDAFSESYHIPAIHQQTLGDTFASKANPFAHLLDAKIFGPHRANSMFGNDQYQPQETSLVEKLGQGALATGNAISAVSVETVEKFLAHPAVNPTKSPSWSMDVNHIFPNTHIDSGQGGFFVHQYWPIEYNKTRHEAVFYINPPKTAVERFRTEQYIARVCEVLLEDLTNVARTQRGLESRAKDFMQLQDNEILIRHGIEEVIKWVEAETLREALSL